MTDETRRWHADSSVSYALAAIALFEYARAHRVRYDFGPLSLTALTDGGLAVSGEPGDLEHAAKVLAEVPGLVEYRPDWPGMDSDWVTHEQPADWTVRDAPAELAAGEAEDGAPPAEEETPPAEDGSAGE